LNYATGLPSAAVFRSENSDVTYYVYAPDGSVLYSIDAASGGHHFYSFDETGSTTFLTGDNGAITDSYGISPYGDVVTAGSSNKTDNPFTWQGQFGVMEEPGTSLFYMRFRYYDSAFARFLSRDPFISPDPLEINPYQYAAGNPVANVDAAGLSKTASTPPFTGGLATLVFPFVTNANGFDAGLAITNTSADPFGTSPRLCSPSPGSAFGFSGYVIAVCNFQAAHGYAFIGDGLGSGGVASNYLAMIR
jgi:RHS repeat-associated protein